MIDILNLINEAKRGGYSEANAEAKVSQDIILMLISRSTFSKNVAVKGGVVMRCLSNDMRRATQDLDLDFIKFSLEDDSIETFVKKLNSVGVISINRYGKIEELNQQDYHGKRIFVELTDESGYVLKTKIDLGVHAKLEIVQEEFCFDVGLNDESVSLLINSKEQMFVEKLRSLLKFGPFSTRYKDIFDIYFLSSRVDNDRLFGCIEQIIFDDEKMRENNMADIINRVKNTFKDKTYVSRAEKSQKNWLDEDLDTVLDRIVSFLKSIA